METQEFLCNHCSHPAHCGHGCSDETCDHCPECACDLCQAKDQDENIKLGYN